MFAVERKPGYVFEVPREQYCAEALGAATKRLPSKASPTSRRHISYYSSPQLAVENRERLPAREVRRRVERRRIRRVAARVRRRAQIERRPRAVVAAGQRIGAVRRE